MKKINPKSFIYGILFSVIVFSIYSFSSVGDHVDSNDSIFENTGRIMTIDPALAATYRSNFASRSPKGNRAINVSVEQYQAMNQEVRDRDGDVSSISGFRMYFGAKSKATDAEVVSITYTLDEQFEENPPSSQMNMAEGFDEVYSQQCPPFCD